LLMKSRVKSLHVAPAYVIYTLTICITFVMILYTKPKPQTAW
jgi:hypothetical protein